MHFDFTFTGSSIATCLSILISAWGIIRGLRKVNQTLSITFWEHKVMWGAFRKQNPVLPKYPDLPA